MTPDYDFETRRSGAAGVIFWIFAATVLFMFLGKNALWGSEDRWAEITREMLITGDWLHTAINWKIYFDKPQLSYWFIIPWAKLLGVNELAVRIPSAIAALAGLFGTIELARRTADHKTAVLSGWMLLSCYGFIFWGRIASADMANMSAAVLAAAWFYCAEEKPAFWKYLVFYLIAMGGALAKGIPAFAVPVVMLIPHLLHHNRWLRHLKFGNFAAACIGLAVYFTPFYLASVMTPAETLLMPDSRMTGGIEMVWHENFVNAFAAPGHSDPFYSYLYNLPRILLPWSLFFAAAAAAAVTGWKQLTENQKELALGTLLVFLMFSCSALRRWYHILPLVPFCCIFTASMIYSEGREKYWDTVITFCRVPVIIAGAAGLSAPVMLPVFKMMFKHLPPALSVAAVPLGGLLVLIVCMLDDKPGNRIERITGIPCRLASLAVGFAVISAVIFGAVQPSLTVYRTEKPFVSRMKTVLAGVPESCVCFYNTDPGAAFMFYMNWQKPVVTVKKQEQGSENGLRGFILRNSGKKAAIICRDRESDLEPLGRELASCGIDINKTVSHTEPGNGKKWRVFLLDTLISAPAGSTIEK